MNTQDIQKLADLARLSVSDEEAGALTKDMNTILEYIKQIENAHIDTVSTGALAQRVVTNVMRDDMVEQSDVIITDKIKQNFPKEKNGFLEVNKIIQND